MELTNFAATLPDDELKKIARQVYDDYEQDEESRQEWLDMHAKWMEIYYQRDKTSIENWQSDECIPVLTEACNQFQARAFKAFFPSRDFVAALPMGDVNTAAARESAERVGKHMSYQLSVEDRNYKPDKNAMFLAAALHGSDFSKTYRDPIKNRNVVERVRAADLVVPYVMGKRNIDEVERKTHIIYKSINETKILAQAGYFVKPASSMTMEKNTPVQDVEDDAQGMNRPARENEDVAKLLEQHRLLDIDGDGIAEPYVVTLDATSKDILRIQVRYEVDDQGEATNNKEPIEYFTHYSFLTNPDGFYGLGYGHMIGSLNDAINKILRQCIDASTLANSGNMSGYISETLGIKGGDNDVAIGKMKKIAKTTDDIAKGIYTFKFPGANQALVNLMEMLVQTAQRVSSTTDAVTGDIEKVVQPLTIMTLLESSLQLPTSVMEQLALSFEDEFAKLFRLNRLYFNQQQAIPNGNGDAVTVTPDDYKPELRIVPIIDPRQVTQQQKMAKAQQLFQFAMSNPELAQNPGAMDEITHRVLASMGIEDIEAILPKPPQPQQIDDQHIENMFYLLPPDKRPPFDVFQNQDHQQHIQIIDELINIVDSVLTPKEQTTPQGVPLIDEFTQKLIDSIKQEDKKDIVMELMHHRRKHVAYGYAIGAQANEQTRGQPGTMAGPAGNSMGISAAPSTLPPGGDMGMQFGQGGAPAGPQGSPPGSELNNGVRPEPGLLGLSSLSLDPRGR